MAIGATGSIPSTTNLLRAQSAYRSNSNRRAQSLAQLATGFRINRASDDPAGLIASESLRQTLAVLDAETTANQRASDQASTADGALGQISDLLGEAKSLVTANANTAGLSAEEKSANQLQIDSILSTVDRLSATTMFGGRKLLDGSATLAASGKSFAIGSAATANLGATDVAGTTYTLADLKTGQPLNTLGANSANAGAVIDRAINDVATQRAQLGAFDRNTLQTRINGIASSREQLLSAVSMIRDTDYAHAVAQHSRSKLLQRSSLAVPSQALGRRRQTSTFSVSA
jgi:flagellin-like hook-associated protein FlgL